METFQLPEPARVNYLNAEYGLKSWLLTRDHKRIALLYLGSISFFFIIGGIYAMLIRLELLTPQGDLLQSTTYNKVFTQHGIVMVFFFLIPSIPATLGNFLVPIMIGAKDLAFPRINLLSWYLYMLGGFITIYALLAGGVDTGWTFYAPYSTTFSNSYVVATGIGIFVSGFSSILTGLNFIVTVHTMRAPGMTWFRLPLFIWSLYATSLVMILGSRRNFRSCYWRRPGSFSTSVLVLLSPGRLHYGPTQYGRGQRIDCEFFPQKYLRVFIRRFLQSGHCSVWFSCVGPSPVRFKPVSVRGHDLFLPELCCSDSLRNKGVQLDSNALQRIHLF